MHPLKTDRKSTKYIAQLKLNRQRRKFSESWVKFRLCIIRVSGNGFFASRWESHLATTHNEATIIDLDDSLFITKSLQLEHDTYKKELKNRRAPFAARSSCARLRRDYEFNGKSIFLEKTKRRMREDGYFCPFYSLPNHRLFSTEPSVKVVPQTFNCTFDVKTRTRDIQLLGTWLHFVSKSCWKGHAKSCSGAKPKKHRTPLISHVNIISRGILTPSSK